MVSTGTEEAANNPNQDGSAPAQASAVDPETQSFLDQVRQFTDESQRDDDNTIKSMRAQAGQDVKDADARHDARVAGIDAGVAGIDARVAANREKEHAFMKEGRNERREFRAGAFQHLLESRRRAK